MMKPLVNCKACLKDNHDDCTHDNCLCEVETNHNEPNGIDSFIKEWNEATSAIPTPSEEIILQIKHTNDERFDLVSARLINKYHFVTAIQSQKIYMFTGKIYDNNKALALIKEECEKQIINCSEHDTLEVISKIKRKTYKDLEDFDSDPNLITVENGILHLDTLELTPHTHENLSKILIPCDFIMPKSYDIEANLKDTLFWKYLTNSFTIKGKFLQEDFETVLEMMASVFVKDQIDEKSFMNLGQGENGKSTTLEYLSQLLGSDNITSIPLQVLSSDKFASSNLDGKLANIFPDLEKNELRHTGIIKVISSGETCYAQSKGKDGFELHPIAKLIFSSNKFPKVYDQTQGFFRRWIIIKWLRDFEKDPERIDKLKQKLKENQGEKNLVFSSLMIIAQQLKTNGKFTFSKDWKTIQKLWNENADPVNDFIENYIIDSESHKGKRETYQFYKQKMFEKGEIPLGMGQFGKAFAEYYEESKNDGVRIWLNIDFKMPKQEELESFHA